MAKFLQIFVFALALAQGYCAVAISTMPAAIAMVPPILLPPVVAETKPLPLPVVPAKPVPLPLPVEPTLPEILPSPIEPVPLPVAPEQPAIPPCVSVVKSILQAIIDRLENIPQIPAVTLPEMIEPEESPSVPEIPEELPAVHVNPCSACFEHISSLLATAQRLATLKALTRQ